MHSKDHLLNLLGNIRSAADELIMGIGMTEMNSSDFHWLEEKSVKLEEALVFMESVIISMGMSSTEK